MSEDFDPQMDRFLRTVGTEWCEKVGASESAFLARFQARLREERAGQASVRKPAKVETVAAPRRFTWVLYAAAAAVLAVVGVTGLMLLSGRNVGSIAYQRGQIMQSGALALEKGSRVVCDAQSAGIITLDKGRITLFLDKETELKVLDADRVRLEQGRAWAVIRPNSGFFEVATPYGNIDVHGTTFGVVVDTDGTRVSLLSGSVTAVRPGETGTLAPNHQAFLPRNPGERIAISSLSVAMPQWVVDLQAEAARQNASKFFPSGAPRNDPHGGLLPCADPQQASL